MFGKFNCFCIKEAEGLEVGKKYECVIHSIPMFIGDDFYYWTEIEGRGYAYKSHFFSKYLKQVIYMVKTQEEYKLTQNKNYFVVGIDVRDGYNYLVFDDNHEFVSVPSMFFNIIEEIGHVVTDYNWLVSGKRK